MKTTKWLAILLTLGILLLFETPTRAQTCAPSTNSIALKCGLKGYWKLDETNSVRFDSSTSKYDLTPRGNVGSALEGSLNRAAVFDSFVGDQGLYVTNPAARAPLTFSGDWTVSTWVKHTGKMSHDADNIFSKWGEVYFFVENYSGSNRLHVRIFKTNELNHTILLDHAFNYVMPSNVWRHLVLQRSANSIQLHINGGLMETVPFTNTIENSGWDFWIGMEKNGWPWNGAIDELGYWGRSLNNAEIAALYGNGTPPTYETFTFGGTAPVITTQPQSQIVTAGSNASFTVSVTGTQPLSYQWLFGTNNIIGATNSTLLLTNITSNQAGTYRVFVANSFGTVLSSNALLSVIPVPPTTLNTGLKAYWTLNETNGIRHDSTTNLHHLTPFNNVGFNPTGKLDGAALLSAFQQNQGLYAAGPNATNSLAFSGEWAVSTWVNHKPAMRYDSDVIFSKAGEFYFFVENYTGAHRLHVRAYKNSTNLLDHAFNYVVPSNLWQHLVLQKTENALVLYVNGTQTESVPFSHTLQNAGNGFWIGMEQNGWPWNGSIDEVGYWGRSLSSAEVAALYGNGNPPAYENFGPTGTAPTISQHPVSITVAAGTNVIFSVTASGTQPLNYQWQFVGNDIAGATNSALTLTNVTSSRAGNYRVVVTNTFGSIISSNAVLTVIAPTNPPNVALHSGLKGYWRLDETNSTRFDATTNQHHLTPHNSVGWNPAGKLNGAALFSAFQSNQGLYAGGTNSRTALAFSGDWTVSTWAKHNATMRYDSDVIFSKAGEIYFFIENYTGAHRLHVRAYNGQSNILEHAFNYVVPANEWQHFVLQRSANSVRLFVNGTLRETVTLIQPIQPSSNAFWVGMEQNGWPWNGLIDEVGYWARALNNNEVSTLFGQGNPPSFDSFVEGVEVAPYVISHPAHQSVSLGATVSFSVTAGGTGPLGYQWFFNGGGISGATNRTLSLTNVHPSAIGGYSVQITNAFGAATSAVATLNVAVPPSALHIGSVTGMAGAPISIPVRLVANGRENALGFSISYNSQLLTFADISLDGGTLGTSWLVNTNGASTGRLGLAVALPPGATFNAGTQQLATIHFQTRLATNGITTTGLQFGDQPTLRQVSDVAAISITATYTNGLVTLLPADLEGDVTPRPTGNRSVTITDWVQVGRFAAGLDVAASGGEFQRADSAPKAVLGDGKIKVSDWVQAGRFAAGLDPLTAVGGPSQEGGGSSSPLNMLAAGTTRELIAKAVSAIHQVRSEVVIGFKATGHENAWGFTVQFDPVAFRYEGITLGTALAGATVNVNTNLLSAGKIGFAIALPLGSTIASGSHDLLSIGLTPTGTIVGPAQLSFADAPVYGSVSDSDANELATTFVAEVVTVHPIPEVASAADGESIRVSWPAWAHEFKLQSGIANTEGFEWHDVSQSVVTNGETLSVTIPMEAVPKFFRLVKP